MATTKKPKKPTLRERVASDPATLELASMSVMIDRMRRRIRRFVTAHPPRCRCPLCRIADPELKQSLTGLAATLNAFAMLVNMDRPQSFRETERELKRHVEEARASGLLPR